MLFALLSLAAPVAAHAAPAGVVASLLGLAALALPIFGETIVPSGDDGGDVPATSESADVIGDRAADPDADRGVDRGAADGGDDEDDEDAGLAPEVRDDPKRLRTRHRRLQRQMGEVRPIADRFRGPDGKYMSPDQIDRMRARAQDMDEVQQLLDANPDILQSMLERRNGRPAAAARDDYQDLFPDDAAIPWDTADPASKTLVDTLRKFHRDIHDLRKENTQLKQGLGTVHERDTARSAQEVEDSWKTQTLAAAKAAGLTGDDHDHFVNSVYLNFRLARAEKRLGKVNRAAILEQALRPFKRTRVAGDRRAAADAHARADANGTRPQPGSRGATTPARASDTNRSGTLKDAREGFFARIGRTPPPGVR